MKEKLDRFHPEILRDSPVVDVRGGPVKINLAESDSPSWTDVFMCEKVEIPSDAKRSIEKILNDYKAHRRWQESHMEIREIRKGDVSPDQDELIGQEGVFAKKRIEPGAVVDVFGGMLLENERDIEIDKRIRKLASCDKYYSRAAEGKILEGMGMPMKLNAATGPGWLLGRDKRNNLKCMQLRAAKATTGEELRIMAFVAAREISENEQMFYPYDIRASRP